MHGVDAVLATARHHPIGARVLISPASAPIDLADVRPSEANASAALSTLLNQASGRADVLIVRKVRHRSHLIAMLPGVGFPFAMSDGGTSAFCDVSHAEALGTLSRDTLRNVDRLRRRAERDFGPVRVESIADPALVHTSGFDRFVRIEDSGWKGASGVGTSLAVDVRAQSFLRDVTGRFGADGLARIEILTIAGVDAAAQLMLRSGTTWFLLKIGYHPDYKDVGPGGILLKQFLEEAITNPDVREVNFTTNPPWAARWHFQTEPVRNVFIYNRTWRGRTMYAGRSVKELVKRAREVVRARLRPPAP